MEFRGLKRLPAIQNLVGLRRYRHRKAQKHNRQSDPGLLDPQVPSSFCISTRSQPAASPPQKPELTVRSGAPRQLTKLKRSQSVPIRLKDRVPIKSPAVHVHSTQISGNWVLAIVVGNERNLIDSGRFLGS